MANPIPILHPQFVGTTDSADFQCPVARPVSGDFHHFFAQIATEYDGGPIRTVAGYYDSAVLPIRPIFRVVSGDFRPVSGDFHRVHRFGRA